MRPGTGMRMGTGMGGGPGAGMQFMGAVGPMASVSITDRPVTQQGLLGLRPSTSGPGRQVQDATYFQGLLRQKINEISTEINRMRTETEKSARDATLMAQLDRKWEALLGEVRSLEGTLADFNLATDKSRTSVDSSEIQQYCAGLRRRNETLSQEVDAVFMERQERERGIVRLEEQISQLQRISEARLASLPPVQLAEYRNLQAESRSLTSEIQQQQTELERLNQQVEAAESTVRSDTLRDECALLEKRIAHLRREKAGLEEDLAAVRLGPAEARERLLAKVKADNATIQALDKDLAEVEEANAARRKVIAEVNAEIDERRNGGNGNGANSESAKYELLFKRDQEMTEFIDRFPDMKGKEVAEHSRMQNTIVALLEHMAEGIDREKAMPDRAAAADMKEDLEDKTRDVKAAQVTQERLQGELGLRQVELDKIASLDSKIGEEMSTVAKRIRDMQNEMPKLRDIEGLRVAADTAKSSLYARVKEYARRRDALRQQAAGLSAEVDKRRAVLSRDPQAQAIEASESKVRAYEQTVFSLKDYLASKAGETDYSLLHAQVMQAVAELNILVQKAQTLR